MVGPKETLDGNGCLSLIQKSYKFLGNGKTMHDMRSCLREANMPPRRVVFLPPCGGVFRAVLPTQAFKIEGVLDAGFLMPTTRAYSIR